MWKGGDPMTLHGSVKNGVVVFHHGDALPDGTLVQVTPLPHQAGNPLAVIAPMEPEPHLSPEAVAELERPLPPGNSAPAAIDPFARETRAAARRHASPSGPP